jgi:peptidoglycan/xylan/chitin deacetylase (PgdA/CDA1 family)
VVLTFDDGPKPETTPAILDALRAACVKATFMMVGRMVDRAPDLARRVAQEGHAIGAHGWSHKPLNKMPLEEATADVRRGFASLERALRGLPRDQAPRPLFRFPSYAQTPELLDWLARADVAVMSADTTSEDWKGGAPEATLALTLERLKRRGSGVVVFHDTQPNTAALLPEFLRRLKAEGFRVVHLRTREPASLPGS